MGETYEMSAWLHLSFVKILLGLLILHIILVFVMRTRFNLLNPTAPKGIKAIQQTIIKTTLKLMLKCKIAKFNIPVKNIKAIKT
ncbi:hypothetical protein, partial [Campylobacter fetus]|uniref:hypothetical protein n=1 Tax=Campylobacter fetus TaxID=196 RepID=UPI001EE3ADB8